MTRGAAGASFEIPEVAQQIFSKYLVTEYAYLTPKGEPLCWPVTPYWYPERKVLAIATGLAYPNKAKFPKRNPKIAMLFSDSRSSGMGDPPRVLVQGSATVIEDVQENTDRYVRELREKFSIARLALNPLTVKLLDFYLPRLWVEMTPEKLVMSPPDEMPESAGSGVAPSPGKAQQLSENELRALHRTVDAFGEAIVTTVDAHGYPLPIRTQVSWDDGRISIGSLGAGSGPAAVTFHRHTLRGTRFEAYMARGHIESGSFVPTRLVGFFGNGMVFPLSVVPHIARLRRTMHKELKRLGAEPPKLRIPS